MPRNIFVDPLLLLRRRQRVLLRASRRAPNSHRHKKDARAHPTIHFVYSSYPAFAPAFALEGGPPIGKPTILPVSFSATELPSAIFSLIFLNVQSFASEICPALCACTSRFSICTSSIGAFAFPFTSNTCFAPVALMFHI